MGEKQEVFILSNSKLMVHSLEKYISVSPVVKINSIGGKTAITVALRNRARNDCFVVLVYDQSLQWLEWLYEIRCKARFRGPCYLLGTNYPVKSQLPVFRGLFETVFKPYQAIFYYKDLHNLLERGSSLPPRLPYRRFRWIQRKIRALYLSISH